MTKPLKTTFMDVRMTKWKERDGLRTLGRTANGIRVFKKITDAAQAGNTVSCREHVDREGRTILNAEIIWDADDDTV